jgi:catechol 2,3-dioxygenase-like lactoylglutathione lyase family enzyme
MAMVSFPDGSYLELIGLQAKTTPELVKQHPWGQLLAADAGPAAWAVREDRIDAEVKRLRAAGIRVSPPVPSGRLRPDGVRLEWQTSDIGTELRGTFFPFLIQDLTPRDLRAFPYRPVSRDFQKISRVVIGVRDLDAAVQKYRQAYNLPAVMQRTDQEFGARLAFIGDLPVVLATPLDSASWLSARIDRFGDGPVAFVLGVTSGERDHTISQSNWLGSVAWFDEKQLGWRLGIERIPQLGPGNR